MTGLHYKRSLASRVTLLATLAVGLSVAIVALAAFATVRMQMMASLDESLLDRAAAAGQSRALSVLTEQQIPSWTVGAADVHIGFVDASGAISTVDRDSDSIEIGEPELEVARGQAGYSLRTVSTDESGVRVTASAANVQLVS